MACGRWVVVNALALSLWATPLPVQAHSNSPFGTLFQDFGGPRRVKPRVRPQALAGIPLPKPRPPDAPGPIALSRTAPEPFPAPLPNASSVPLPESRPMQAEPPLPQAAPQVAEPVKPAQPSACRVALSEDVAIAPSIPDITGPGACGGTDLVRLEAVVIAGKGKVPLKPAGTMRCEMATAVANWIREDMAPLATSLGTTLAELDNFDSFDCRGRNRVKGAKMSEHGRANALDVRGLKLANGQFVSLTDPASPRAAREKVLQSVCGRFTTVLGPGSDGYHEDHIHLDIAERRGGYRICQWAIIEPMPQVAPLMPAERPADAPPRVVADGKAQATPAPSAAEAEPDSAPPPKPVDRRRSRTLRQR